MEESALENPLVIRDPPNLRLPLLGSKASRPVHLPVELYSPFLGLFPVVTHLLHADVDFVIVPQLSLVKSIPLQLSCSDLGFVNGGFEDDQRRIVSWYLSGCPYSRNLSQLLSTSEADGEPWGVPLRHLIRRLRDIHAFQTIHNCRLGSRANSMSLHVRGIDRGGLRVGRDDSIWSPDSNRALPSRLLVAFALSFWLRSNRAHWFGWDHVKLLRMV
jgi:hypothetical protein